MQRLHSPNLYLRDLAQRLLIERRVTGNPAGRGAREQLHDLAIGDAARKTRLHALWASLALAAGGRNAADGVAQALRSDDSPAPGRCGR